MIARFYICVPCPTYTSWIRSGSVTKKTERLYTEEINQRKHYELEREPTIELNQGFCLSYTSVSWINFRVASNTLNEPKQFQCMDNIWIDKYTVPLEKWSLTLGQYFGYLSPAEIWLSMLLETIEGRTILMNFCYVPFEMNHHQHNYTTVREPYKVIFRVNINGFNWELFENSLNKYWNFILFRIARTQNTECKRHTIRYCWVPKAAIQNINIVF